MLNVYLLNPNYLVKKRTPGLLAIETSSGRNIFLLFVILVLLLQQDWIKYPGMSLSLLILTYKKEWTLDKLRDEIKCESTILWMSFHKELVKMTALKEIVVKRGSDAQQIGDIYKLYLRTSNGERRDILVTHRRSYSLLLPIVKDIRAFLPESVKYIPLE